jgi:hypothetical protein
MKIYVAWYMAKGKPSGKNPCLEEKASCAENLYIHSETAPNGS